jgi:hypothetical protein
MIKTTTALYYIPNGGSPSWSWSYGSWIYDYQRNQCLSPLTLWVWLLDKGIRYWQFTWQPYIYLDDTYKRGNPNVLMVLQEERDLNCMYSNICIVLQNPHLIHTTPRVASVTVTLKPGFITNNIINLAHVSRMEAARRGRDRMVVGFMTTNAISVYHH